MPYRPRRRHDPSPPLLELCNEHQKRYRADFKYHYGPIISKLARKWLVRRGIAQTRVDDVLNTLSDAMHQSSWQATWVQMVDLELLHAGNGGQRGREVNGVWVPDDARPSAPRPYPGYTPKRSELPEHATRAGQAAIAKRKVEEAALERRLAAEVADFAKGQRQVLELELKTKRAAAAAEARKAKAKA